MRGNRILSVGTDGEVRAVAGADALVVDLAGKTVLPGFVDPHTHVIAGSVVDAVMEYVGMARFATVAEVLDHIGQRVAETPAGEWLVFRNFDPAVQEGLDELTFADLVILDQDPRAVEPDSLKDIKVVETWMDGRQVYKV
jgi:predicted amidohydrolase YtcJ